MIWQPEILKLRQPKSIVPSTGDIETKHVLVFQGGCDKETEHVFVSHGPRTKT